ncbi:hypothetical protein FBR06_07980 [Betaproteobacteria bacterium PRO4]|nr:hypothetical protein [Betaproteobacteria bacterium PRO4]
MAMDVPTSCSDHAVATEALFADQIEIFRGSSALLYGSGASSEMELFKGYLRGAGLHPLIRKCGGSESSAGA